MAERGGSGDSLVPLAGDHELAAGHAALQLDDIVGGKHDEGMHVVLGG